MIYIDNNIINFRKIKLFPNTNSVIKLVTTKYYFKKVNSRTTFRAFYSYLDIFDIIVCSAEKMSTLILSSLPYNKHNFGT